LPPDTSAVCHGTLDVIDFAAVSKKMYFRAHGLYLLKQFLIRNRPNGEDYGIYIDASGTNYPRYNTFYNNTISV